MHPFVITHPVSGCKSIMCHGGSVDHFIEWLPGSVKHWGVEETWGFLEEIMAPAVAPELQYTHRWVAEDLVLWDQRRLMHIAPPSESYAPERRIHHRIRLTGTTVPFGDVDLIVGLQSKM